jgi:ribonuclease Z
MFDLTFLGTSASVPSADRNHPGLMVEAGGHRIMVDCGEGTQRQLLRSGAGFRRLDRLLLTHGHFDHVLGIPGLFSTLRLRQSTDVMTIHGSPGTLDIVVRMLAGLWGEGRAPIPLQLVPLVEGRISITTLGRVAVALGTNMVNESLRRSNSERSPATR